MQNLTKISGGNFRSDWFFLLAKIGPKRPIFYLNAYMAEFLYA